MKGAKRQFGGILIAYRGKWWLFESNAGETINMERHKIEKFKNGVEDLRNQKKSNDCFWWQAKVSQLISIRSDTRKVKMGRKDRNWTKRPSYVEKTINKFEKYEKKFKSRKKRLKSAGKQKISPNNWLNLRKCMLGLSDVSDRPIILCRLLLSQSNMPFLIR